MKNQLLLILAFIIGLGPCAQVIADELPREVIGIEILVAQDSSQSLNSRFGHAMIRLVDSDESWSNDQVYSFGYEVQNTTLERSKFKEILGTINGAYELKMTELRLGDVWNRYELSELRNISRIVIATNQDIRAEIISRLELWQREPQRLGAYSLLGNNCASVLSELLKDSGIPLRESGIIKPNSFTKYLFESSATWLAPLKFTSKKSTLEELNINEENLSEFFTDDEINHILETWSDDDIKKIMVFNVKVSTKMLRKIRQQRKIALTNESLEDVAGHVRLPSTIYELCQTNQCVQEKQEEVLHIMGAEFSKQSKKNLERYPNFRLIQRSSEENESTKHYYTLSQSPYSELYELEYSEIQSKF